MRNFKVIAPDLPVTDSRPGIRPYGDILSALRSWDGYWIVIDLSTVEGSTPAAKRAAIGRAARQRFHPIQTKLRDGQFLIRRVAS
jgi:hypothetical protein